MTDGVRDWESKCVGAEGAEEVSVRCGTQLGGVGICIGNDSVGAGGLRNGSVQGNVVLDGGHEVGYKGRIQGMFFGFGTREWSINTEFGHVWGSRGWSSWGNKRQTLTGHLPATGTRGSSW